MNDHPNTEASSNLKEDCDLDILLTNENPVATLKSPFFPTDYLNDLDCSIIVKAPIGSHPTLQFHHFDIEDSDKCVP
ncbi:hypothetical protein CHS0354_013486 [Potamilus streckersoni]|uniref:CUB domain-containing protein n=1 Tax=Potamilus streckersoni TaxID=2493646 RepID=A0AAE0T997_9BIVA|nr:hypothetical protein CHS0354_013486 [Potamilus streckersoni]